MPLYEYECSSCDRRVEVIQRFSDEPLRVCSDCGGEVKRLISAPAVQFKGTGWYVTDYGKSSEPSSSKEATDNAAKKETKDKGGGESRASSDKAKAAATSGAD